MAHWRDGGIGNMAGSDDRPIEEWTLLEKLADVASAPVGSLNQPYVMRLPGDWATPLKQLAQEAFDEIQRLRKELGMLDPGQPPVAMILDWQPIDTAPVPPRDVLKYASWRCLIQTKSGAVMEGFARWVQANGSNAAIRKWVLRWYDREGSWLGDRARYWMPLPAPMDENGGAA